MQNKPLPSFNFISPVYDGLVQFIFGNNLRQAQLHFINKIPANSRILIIGGGTGWYLKELLNLKLSRAIVYLEASEDMLALSKNLVKHHPEVVKVAFRLGDENSILPDEKFDVIISNFFLDLFAPVPFARIITILYQALQPHGFWFVTDFMQPSGNIFIRLAGRFLLKAMYLFFKVVAGISADKLPDWDKSLQEINLKSGDSLYFYHRLIKTTFYIKTANL